MSIANPRIVMVVVAFGSLFPLWALIGLVWTAMLMAAGFGGIFSGAVAKGVAILIWSIAAFYGLVTIIELLAHYWRTPGINPSGRLLSRSTIGLTLGWLAILLPPTGLIMGMHEVGELVMPAIFGAFVTPTALVVSLMFFFNRNRSHCVE